MALSSLAAQLTARGFGAIGASFKRKKLEQKISTGQGNKDDYVWLSDYYINKKDYFKAESYAKKALELSPDDDECKEALVSAFIMQDNRYQEALELTESRIENQPNSGVLHYYAGFCHFKLGNLEKANELREKAVKLDSSLKRARYK